MIGVKPGYFWQHFSLCKRVTILVTVNLKIMKAGNFLSAILLSAAAGAAVGILFAPDKGSKTRNRIRRRSDDLKEKLNSLVDDAVEKYEDVLERSEKVKKAIS